MYGVLNATWFLLFCCDKRGFWSGNELFSKKYCIFYCSIIFFTLICHSATRWSVLLLVALLGDKKKDNFFFVVTCWEISDLAKGAKIWDKFFLKKFAGSKKVLTFALAFGKEHTSNLHETQDDPWKHSIQTSSTTCRSALLQRDRFKVRNEKRTVNLDWNIFIPASTNNLISWCLLALQI